MASISGPSRGLVHAYLERLKLLVLSSVQFQLGSKKYSLTHSGPIKKQTYYVSPSHAFSHSVTKSGY